MIALGIAVAVLSAIADAFAVVLQAGEARRAPAARAMRVSLLVGLAHRRRWVLGTALMVIEWPLQVLALALAPITVVQPALCSGQLVLLALARFKLRERIGRTEVLGAVAIVVGIGGVVWAAPKHSAVEGSAVRLAVPMAVVGGAAIGAYLLSRRRPAASLGLVVGAGLSYAWTDFANKLLANDASQGHIGLALIWLLAAVLSGAAAFLQETSAMQRRPAVTVAPVIAAVKTPLPVLMALWAGVEVWGSSANRIAVLLPSLAVVAAGAALLGRSEAVARICIGTSMEVKAF